ncbi:hypothetical protein CANARDRAFT_82449 [[Candida] arabinofermentans NRRL YB-2248]|uniref:Uncharacterized protein n=1 Tax=[Candida] arabinofermentans NRRL YB-2248 TaxID=983967 RepID=A0A1E4SUY1_9ASCO|nr:hypothetical protein CANARDRAFT_82449 [[Candida] arabinofermentans NRRL YB-2248]
MLVRLFQKCETPPSMVLSDSSVQQSQPRIIGLLSAVCNFYGCAAQISVQDAMRSELRFVVFPGCSVAFLILA